MKNFFFTYVIISLFICNTSHAKWGSGNLKLNKNTMEFAISYMYGAGNKERSGNAKKRNDPLMMAVSIDGIHSQAFYCPAQYSNRCETTGIALDAILRCQQLSNETPCFIFAQKRRVVWENGGSKLTIKKKDLKSPYIVAKKIQEAGFYDGELSDLAGVDISTGQINNEIKLTGEKKNSNNSNKKNSSIVEELETLTKLYENGSLSKEEFDKAKNKLFSE